MTNELRIQHLVVLRGLPGSGRQEYSHWWVQADPDFRVRVSWLDIGHQLYKKRDGFSRHQRNTIETIMHAQSTAGLKAGLSVLIDHHNLDAASVKDWFSSAEKKKVPCEVLDFHFTVDECIRRDASSENPAGEIEIYSLAKRFLKKGQLPPLPARPKASEVQGSLYVPDPDLPKAYIFDVDGTLARMHGRSPYAWDRVGEDSPIENVITMAKNLDALGYALIGVSGRDEVCRDISVQWLEDHGVNFTEFYMRPFQSDDGDDEMKLRFFDNHIRNKWHILGVFDDRLRVCRMWENIGLTLFRVGPLDSDF